MLYTLTTNQWWKSDFHHWFSKRAEGARNWIQV